MGRDKNGKWRKMGRINQKEKENGSKMGWDETGKGRRTERKWEGKENGAKMGRAKEREVEENGKVLIEKEEKRKENGKGKRSEGKWQGMRTGSGGEWEGLNMEKRRMG